MNKPQFNQDMAYVLHSVPYKETSLIVEMFCKEHGRLPVVAKGAKRPYSGLRSVLVSFQPLQIRFSGKSEVRILTQAHWCGGLMAPEGKALFAAYYLNELLMRGLEREDAHTELFDLYQHTLMGLNSAEDMNVCVRKFEVGLLQALGYGLDWQQDKAGCEIDESCFYVWLDQLGWSPLAGSTPNTLPPKGNVEHAVCGQLIVQIQQAVWSKTAANALRPLTRQLLLNHIAPNGLMSRIWMENFLKND